MGQKCKCLAGVTEDQDDEVYKSRLAPTGARCDSSAITASYYMTTLPVALGPEVSNAAVSAVCQPTITATTRPCLAPAAGLAASLLAV